MRWEIPRSTSCHGIIADRRLPGHTHARIYVPTCTSHALPPVDHSMSTAPAFPGTYRAHQHNRQRALEVVQNENTALTRFLFETIATDEKSQKTSRQLLSLLEKHDRNLEGQLAQVQQYVLDRRAALEEAKVAFEHHLNTHGRANDGHQETLTSFNRLASLEDKKHVSLVSLGQAEHSSTSVKEKINVTRRERLLFDEMREKYRKELGRIGGEVLCMVKECMERIERTKKSKACVARLQAVARREEEAWASGWRAQILRMEAFTEREGRSQLERAEEKRARAVELLGVRCGPGRTVKDKGAMVGPGRQRGVEGDAGDALARVVAHVFRSDVADSECESPHLAIVRAFSEARTTGVANLLVVTGEKQAKMRPIVEEEPKTEPEYLLEAAADTEDGSTGSSIEQYRRLIEQLCEAAGISVEVGGTAGGDVGQQLLTLLAMIELVVLVNTANRI